MWDLSSLTRDRTCTPAVEAQSLNHWTTREVPQRIFNVWVEVSHPMPAFPTPPHSLCTYFLYFLPAPCTYNLVQVYVNISLYPAGSTLSMCLGSPWGVSLVPCYSGEAFLCVDGARQAFILRHAVLMPLDHVWALVLYTELAVNIRHLMYMYLWSLPRSLSAGLKHRCT